MLSLFAILCGILNFRFAPSLNGLIYHGDKVARTELTRNYMPKTVGPGFSIIITSYLMAMFDAKFLANYKWKSHDLNYCPCKQKLNILFLSLECIPHYLIIDVHMLAACSSHNSFLFEGIYGQVCSYTSIF